MYMVIRLPLKKSLPDWAITAPLAAAKTTAPAARAPMAVYAIVRFMTPYSLLSRPTPSGVQRFYPRGHDGPMTPVMEADYPYLAPVFKDP